MSRRRASTRVATEPATTIEAATMTKTPRTRRKVPKTLFVRSTSVRVSTQSFVPTWLETSETNCSTAFGCRRRRNIDWLAGVGPSARKAAGSSQMVASPSG
jgi:hypothetical protein